MMNGSIKKEKHSSLSEIPDVILDILRRRGVVNGEEIERFLYPRIQDLPHPQGMKNLERAADVVVGFLDKKLPIYLWGDYDVDGTTGTALLVNFFRELGVAVQWHIPNRLVDGYGLQSQWFLDNAGTLMKKPFLLITIDCGISNGAEVEMVNRLGGTVVITDHHALPVGPLPDALVVNPSQQECGFHDYCLAGVGVAFYLAAAIRAKLASRPQWQARLNGLVLKHYLAFVALGTIADMVELSLPNRILVRAGLEAIGSGKFNGINALLRSCEFSGEFLSSEDISFYLAPLLNAAGRLGDSEIVVQLLTEENPDKARKLASKLVALNSKRKNICLENLDLALASISNSLILRKKCIIIKGSFHLGVAGIVASRLVDMYQVPAIVFTSNGPAVKGPAFTGSARSVDGVNIVQVLERCAPHTVKFGGHAMAAGVTVAQEAYDDFERELYAAIAEEADGNVYVNKRNHAYNCSIDTIMRDEILSYLQLIEPFGPGNELPFFIDSHANIVDARRVGRKYEHLQLTVRGKYANWKGIGFHCGEKLNDVQRSQVQKVMYFPTKNRYRGTVSWQIRVVDIL